MIKKCAAFFILFVLVSLESGCQTAVRGGTGAAAGAVIGGTKGAVVGAKKDYYTVKAIDAWIKENLW